MPRSKATSTADRRRHGHPPRYRFIGGKGGVGKTTCAAALGIASAGRGRSTLILSTDPAPSLGDALGQRLGGKPRAVRGLRALHAAEVHATSALARWIAARRPVLESIALRGTWLDREDVSRLLELSLPGIDEIAGLLEIAALGADPHYDQIIVDAAPTGHLLRMLGMPAVLGSVAHVFDHMQAKHRIMVQALRGSWSPDSADALIEAIDREARGLHELLRDRERATMSWVTLAEPMSVEETADAVGFLRAQGILVDSVIVNRLTPRPPRACRWCDARRWSEQESVRALASKREMRGLRMLGIAAADAEPRGTAALAALGRQLERARKPAAPRGRPAAGVTTDLPVRTAGVPPPMAERLAPAGSRLIMFGGKGGVGKTTCAAAAALEIAAAWPDHRVLLLSTDPAHSVGDALGQPFTDHDRPVRAGPANLKARELDASRAFEKVRGRFEAAVERLFQRAATRGAIEVSVARQDLQVMQDLVELAPPGIDELAAILDVLETLIPADGPATTDLVIMDAAPTGHALRLIEMPGLIHEWVKALMAILLKYQPAAGVGELGAVLLGLSKGLRRLRDLLSDPIRARFVVVTRTGALPRAETARLLERLDATNVSAPVVIVNAAGAGACGRCAHERALQRKEIATLQSVLPRGRRRPLTMIAPAAIPPPHGVRALRAWMKTWRTLPLFDR
jgi:arsenite-transporting ATPase